MSDERAEPTTPEERDEVVRSTKVVMELLTSWALEDAEAFAERVEAIAQESPDEIELTLYGLVAGLDHMVKQLSLATGIDRMALIRRLGLGLALYEDEADDDGSEPRGA